MLTGYFKRVVLFNLLNKLMKLVHNNYNVVLNIISILHMRKWSLEGITNLDEDIVSKKSV